MTSSTDRASDRLRAQADRAYVQSSVRTHAACTPRRASGLQARAAAHMADQWRGAPFVQLPMGMRCSSRVRGLPTLATALEVAHRRVKATAGASLPAQTYRPAVEVGCHPAPCPGGRRVEKSKIRLASPLGVLLLDSYATERMVVGPSANPRAPPRPPHRTKPSVTSKINQRCVNKGAWAGGGTIHHRGARPRG